MPLIKGAKAKTKKGFKKNLETEIQAGKPKNQALAIASLRLQKKQSPELGFSGASLVMTPFSVQITFPLSTR